MEHSTAESFVGRAGRVAHVLPFARPFVASLYGALHGSETARTAGAREAPPGFVATRRFRSGAQMLLRILTNHELAPVPVCRYVLAVQPPVPTIQQRSFEVDACPWGGGAILKEDGRPVEIWYATWTTEDIVGNMKTGDCASQTSFEALALLISLVAWCAESSAVALGDNFAALQAQCSLNGRGDLLLFARAFAVRLARTGVSVPVAHLPGAVNFGADCLSRLEAPEAERKKFPSALLGIRRRAVPRGRQLLQTLHALD